MKVQNIILLFILLLIQFQSHSQTVIASSFGYNPNDATSALMNAINSPNDTIIVDLQAAAWKVESMSFFNLNNKTIIFEPGVIIEALAGGFMGYYDCLFRFVNGDNINLIGYGAVFQMNKAEYALIDDSEYRHSINLYSTKNFTVQGLTLIESGGDGLAIDGDNQNYSENIYVEDVRFLDHYRQGLSILNVQNMTVRHCEFSGTAGILPEAGIDIEPYQTTQRVIDLLIEDCRFEGNGWSGVAVNLFELDGTSLPVSITVRDCVFKNNCREDNIYVKAEIYASDDYSNPVQGSVLFERCFIEESNYSAFYARKTASGYSLTFKDCAFQNVSKLPILYNEPVALEVADYDNPSPTLGGIHFDNVLIQYETDYAFFRIFDANTLAGIENITGNIIVVEPNGNSPIYNSNGTQNNITFTYSNQINLQETFVGIEAIETQAIECTQQAGEIIFSRTSSNVNYPIGVSYEISGIATNGNDYHLLPLGTIIATNHASTTLSILARDDDIEEEIEMLELEILPTPLYSLNTSVAEILLFDCEPLSIPNLQSLQNTLHVYPNPVLDKLTIKMLASPYERQIVLFDLLGRYVGMQIVEENLTEIEFDVNSLKPGVYILRLNDGSLKFIKE